MFYHPGLLTGGILEHDCSRQRSVGYFLEPLIQLAPFSKKPIHITLRGITNGPKDPSVSARFVVILASILGLPRTFLTIPEQISQEVMEQLRTSRDVLPDMTTKVPGLKVPRCPGTTRDILGHPGMLMTKVFLHFIVILSFFILV